MRPTCAQFKAPAHIGQGSTVTYKVQSVKYFPPMASVAAVTATISAWAVVSCSRSVMLCPRPMTRPRQTMTAPMGISPAARAAPASRKASRMYFSSCSIGVTKIRIKKHIKPKNVEIVSKVAPIVCIIQGIPYICNTQTMML